MINKIILLILMMSAVLAYSQVTLTHSYNPVIGDVQINTNCDTTGIFQGFPGPSQVWTYPAFTTRYFINLRWINPAATPYFMQFQNANIASTYDTTNYSFYRTTSTNFFVEGYGGPSATIPYYDEELFMQYPFTYNSTFNDNYSADFYLGAVPMHRTGSINVVGDGWGTLNVPAGTFTNALRVKYTTTTKDSATTAGLMILLLNTTSYIWYVPGKKFPLLEITFTYSYYNGTLLVYNKLVNYNPVNTPVGILPISSEISGEFKLYQNYPNPFNPSTKIQFAIPKSSNVKLAVYDIAGKELEVIVNEQLKAGTYQMDWNASAFSSGTYFYKLSTNEFVETKKMLMVK